MRAHRAHAGVITVPSSGPAEDFAAFCDRQRSRVDNLARAGHRRYVTRVLKTMEQDHLDVTVIGYGIGGGSARPNSDE